MSDGSSNLVRGRLRPITALVVVAVLVFMCCAEVQQNPKTAVGSSRISTPPIPITMACWPAARCSLDGRPPDGKIATAAHVVHTMSEVSHNITKSGGSEDMSDSAI